MLKLIGHRFLAQEANVIRWGSTLILSKLFYQSHELPHVEQVMHHSHPMRHSNSFGRVRAD